MQTFKSTVKRYDKEDSLEFLVTNSKRLVIVMAGLPGKPCFQFYGTLKKLGYNVIFLCDKNKSWYNNGINSDENQGIESLTYILKELTAFFDDDNIYFLGGSMGGYASLLYSSIIKKGCVLAFSPQTILKEHYGWYPNTIKDKNMIYNDLSLLDFTNVNITVISSELPIDILSLKNLSNVVAKNKKLFISKENDHNIARVLKNRNLLEGFLKSYIEDKRVKYFTQDNSFINDNSYSSKDLELLLDYIYTSNYIEAKEIADKLSMINGYYRLNILLGKVYFFNKLYDLALKQFNEAFRNIEFTYDDFRYIVAIKAIKDKQRLPVNLYYNFVSSYGLKMDEATFFISTATLCSKVKESKLALLFRQHIDTTFKNRANLYQLGKLSTEMKDFKNAQKYFLEVLIYNDRDWMYERITEYYFPLIGVSL